MQIECPKCFKENDLDGAPVTCTHCKEDISNYKFKSPILSATTALVLGVGGFYAADKYVLPDDRYPLAVEYSIIDSCLSNDRRPIAYQIYDRKRNICICTLEETLKDVSYRNYRKDQANFITQFERNVRKCS
jgi:hypothetical protein